MEPLVHPGKSLAEEDCELSLAFHWFLPTYGDSRNLVSGGHGTAMSGDRPATLKYLHQICTAAEDNGFEAVLTPTGLWCEDAWLTTAMLVESTETLKYLVAFRPGMLSPTLAAQMAGTFQRHSEGRLLLNVVTGGEPHEQRAYGIPWTRRRGTPAPRSSCRWCASCGLPRSR